MLFFSEVSGWFLQQTFGGIEKHSLHFETEN